MCNINRRTVYIVIRDHLITGSDLLGCARRIAWMLDQPEARGTVKEVLDKLIRGGDIEFCGAQLRVVSLGEREERERKKILEVQRRRRSRRRTAIRRQTKKGSCWRGPEARDPEWDPEEPSLSEQEYGLWCACTTTPHSPIGGWSQFDPGTLDAYAALR